MSCKAISYGVIGAKLAIPFANQQMQGSQACSMMIIVLQHMRNNAMKPKVGLSPPIINIWSVVYSIYRCWRYLQMVILPRLLFKIKTGATKVAAYAFLFIA